MSVAQNHSYIGMTEKLANDVEIHSGLNQAAREMMAQVMKPEIDDRSSLDDCAPGLVDVSKSLSF